ncbi:PIN domain-containing protein [Rufibacter sp. LB8]|uniref:PIN domain-containing protein n=1 Tax=Rufibacter sp. LB8 TaxID=2777781 RepID=UPI00178C68A4|nr:PIN domain-containing protein [Rufibacter sp. LB8]
MKALLDTNILIHREAAVVRNEDIGQLFSWLDKLRLQKVIHPISVEEINRHGEEKVKKSFAIKLSSYHLIKALAPIHAEVTKVSKKLDHTPNDINDSQILNEVFTGRVDILISEDKRIHLKASELGISDRVFKIEKFIEKCLAEHPELTDYKVLAVKKELFGHIELQDEFFDSFRSDYDNFDGWFNRKADEIAYVCYADGKICAFLFLKTEGTNEPYSDMTPPLPPKKRLKIGTFKVTLTGFKLGERFLKIIFDNALSRGVDEIYVTIFPKRPEQQRLIDLLSEWGFVLWGVKKTKTAETVEEENVYVRNFRPHVDHSNPKFSFPYISRRGKAYIVPIYPEYHTELFPDSILNNESRQDFVENEPHRNALSKSYISHSYIRNFKKGDVIIFYRTGGYHKSVVTTIAIVEEVLAPVASAADLIKICRKRTVLTETELMAYWDRNPKNRPFVVNFLYTYSFPKRPNMARLIDLGVLGGVDDAPRTFTQISWEKVDHILKASESNESIIID